MQGKIFIFFIFLMLLVFLLPTHPFFNLILHKSGDFQIFPYIRLDNFILFCISFTGFVLLYFSGIIQRLQLKKEIKILSKENTLQHQKNEQQKPAEHLEQPSQNK